MENQTENIHILIIDDDIISGHVMAKVLKKNGYHVHYFNNGKDGLDYLHNNKVDLVLLDFEMPDINGEQVLVTIRSTEKYQYIPILIVTATENNDNILKMFKLEANDYLIKPVNLPVMMARIGRFINVVDKFQADVIANELKAIKAIIGTYNHEINNPLASALGFLDIEINKQGGSNKYLEKVRTSLERISEIVKRMQQISKNGFKYEQYTEQTKIVKINEP